MIIGSGAGGGTLAYELTQRGIPCVVLEAGPWLRPEDYENDEWKAFNQMAWLDKRTASGSFRVARDFPNLPAWIVKAVGGSTTHWAAPPRGSASTSSSARTYYGDVEGANLLDWPIALADLAPYYDQAEKAIGSTHRHGRAPQPANNNYKVFANGAEKIGYRYYATGPYGTNAEPYDGRPASIQDGFNFQGDKSTAKWSTAVREVPRAVETGKCDLRASSQAVQITHDAQGRANAVIYLDGDGNLHRQAAKVVCVAGNSIESPRLLLMSASALHPDGLANSSGQVGRNYMRHTTGSVYARFEEPVRMYRGETMAGIVADEARQDTSRGFAGGYYMETLSLGPAFLAVVRGAGVVGPGVHRAHGRLREHRGPVDRGRGHAAGDQPGHPRTPRIRTSGACRSRTCTSTTTPTTSRCASTATSAPTCSTRRSVRWAPTTRRRTPPPTTSAPAG